MDSIKCLCKKHTEKYPENGECYTSSRIITRKILFSRELTYQSWHALQCCRNVSTVLLETGPISHLKKKNWTKKLITNCLNEFVSVSSVKIKRFFSNRQLYNLIFTRRDGNFFLSCTCNHYYFFYNFNMFKIVANN